MRCYKGNYKSMSLPSVNFHPSNIMGKIRDGYGLPLPRDFARIQVKAVYSCVVGEDLQPNEVACWRHSAAGQKLGVLSTAHVRHAIKILRLGSVTKSWNNRTFEFRVIKRNGTKCCNVSSNEPLLKHENRIPNGMGDNWIDSR